MQIENIDYAFDLKSQLCKKSDQELDELLFNVLSKTQAGKKVFIEDLEVYIPPHLLRRLVGYYEVVEEVVRRSRCE